MNKLQFHNNKVLKLTNVLKCKILIDEESFDLNVAIEQMQSYIKIKGTMQVGPLIQYTRTFINDAGELDMEMIMMLQCSNYINTVEHPYTMESCRYTGPEGNLKFAYDKIQLEAFENDISLKGDSYTIFVDRDEENETITADVFMERSDK